MSIQRIIVVLGPPGSGKGTQGKMLAFKLNCAYLSMGQHLREFSVKGTELAKKVKETIDSGTIIPDDWMKIIFREKILELMDQETIILDGFPRDINQVPILDDFIKEVNIWEFEVVFLNVPEEILIARIKERKNKETRADDNPEIIHTRFKEYEKKTLPVIETYRQRGNLIEIDGHRDINTVHQELMSKLRVKDKQ